MSTALFPHEIDVLKALYLCNRPSLTLDEIAAETAGRWNVGEVEAAARELVGLKLAGWTSTTAQAPGGWRLRILKRGRKFYTEASA